MFSSRDGTPTSRFTNRSSLTSVSCFGEELAMTAKRIALPDAMRRPLSPRLDERYRFVVEGGIPKREAT